MTEYGFPFTSALLLIALAPPGIAV